MRIEGYEFKTDFLRRAFAEGKAEGTRGTLLMVLEGRGLVPSRDELRRIESCTDAAELAAWARKAALVDRVADLFE